MDVLFTFYLVCICMDAERWRLGTLHIHFIPGHYFISAESQYNVMIILNVLADDKPLVVSYLGSSILQSWGNYFAAVHS